MIDSQVVNVSIGTVHTSGQLVIVRSMASSHENG